MFRRIHNTALSLAAVALFLTTPAYAGKFRLHTFGETYGVDAVNWVNDIVTDAFTRRFPSEKYEIVVLVDIVDIVQLGDTVCYATVGVSAKPQGEKPPRIPKYRFNSMNILRNAGLLRAPEKRDCLKTVVRIAVQNLMDVDTEKLAKDSAASLVD